MVWIKRVDPNTMREAVKYVTKATDLIEGDDPTQLVEFMLATRGRRMVQGFGTFYALELVDEEPTAVEAVTLSLNTGGFDSSGGPLVIRYRLPRFCRQCGRDTRLAGGECTYEPPVVIPRNEVRLQNGFATWRPAP